VPKGWEPAAIDLNKALGLLSLPREVGAHPEKGEMITAGIGRYGPYLRMGSVYVSLKDGDDVLDVGLNRAVTLLADASPKGAPAKALGAHPLDGKPVNLRSGRYGPYLEHGSVRARLPKNVPEENLDLEKAVSLLAAKAPQKRNQKKAAGGKSARKTSSKKKSAAG
jgi:DNA topoisomerase-1